MVAVKFNVRLLVACFGEALTLAGPGSRVNVGETTDKQIMITSYFGIHHYRRRVPAGEGNHPAVREYGYLTDSLTRVIDGVLKSGSPDCLVCIQSNGDLTFGYTGGLLGDPGGGQHMANINPIAGSEHRCYCRGVEQRPQIREAN